MSTPAKTTKLKDGPPVPAELVFVAMIALLGVLLSLAGVPLAPEKSVTDGSDALRKGWLEQRQAESLAEASNEDSEPSGAPLQR